MDPSSASDRRDSTTTTTTTTTTSIGIRFVSDEVKRDHRDLEILYKGLLQSIEDGDAQAAAQLQSQFAWELARHLVALQLFIFPGTERRANAGNQTALKRREDLAELRDHILEFIHLRPLSDEFSASADALGELLRKHIKHIEMQDLVAIEKNLEADESERMAWDWVRTCTFVPGRARRRSRVQDGGGDGKEEEGVQRQPPFESVDELLKAPIKELQKALAGSP